MAIISEDNSTEGFASAEEKPSGSRRRKKEEDPVLADIRRQFANAQTELASVKNALATSEPVTERTTFLNWVREVCKTASDDQFTEFQTNFIQLQARWRKQNRSTQMQPCQTQPGSSSQSPECGGFQPMPNQWRVQPPHLRDSSPWQSQSTEYMQAYMQQPFLNPATSSSDATQAVSSALFNLNDNQSP